MMKELAQVRFSIGALLVGAVFLIVGVVDDLSIGAVSLAVTSSALRALVAVLGLALIGSAVWLGWRELAQGDLSEHKKPLDHYVLFWWRGENDWAKEDWAAAGPFVSRFKYAAGFLPSDARNAKKVTIVGASTGVSARIERELKESGCEVRRLDGQWADDTAALLSELTQKGDEFVEGNLHRTSPH